VKHKTPKSAVRNAATAHDPDVDGFEREIMKGHPKRTALSEYLSPGLAVEPATSTRKGAR